MQMVFIQIRSSLKMKPCISGHFEYMHITITISFFVLFGYVVQEGVQSQQQAKTLVFQFSPGAPIIVLKSESRRRACGPGKKGVNKLNSYRVCGIPTVIYNWVLATYNCIPCIGLHIKGTCVSLLYPPLPPLQSQFNLSGYMMFV